MAKIDAFFNLMFEQKASDLHLSSGNNPMLRINGELHRVEHPPLDSDLLKSMLYEIAPEYKIKTFEETGDVDFGYEIPNISRFRANFFNQKNGCAPCSARFPARCCPSRTLKNLTRRCRRSLKRWRCSTRDWSL